MAKIKSGILTVIGVFFTACAVSQFYLPNKIVNGGVSGASTILYHIFSIPPGVTYAAINIILLILGYRFLGKSFIIKTLICSGLMSVFVQLLSFFPPITKNTFLASVFGALLYGFGIGITLTQGSSTGGTDILARLLQYIFPHISIGKTLMLADTVVIIFSLLVFRQTDLALYGIISLFISTLAIDVLISKLNVSKLAFVISDFGNEISKKLISSSGRGVTVFNVRGAFTGHDKQMLMCALKENEIPNFQQKILETDKNAFIIFAQSQQIIGNGFFVYK